MDALTTREICEIWVGSGMGDECFWEGWPDCPTPSSSLKPNMILDSLDGKVLYDKHYGGLEGVPNEK